MKREEGYYWVLCKSEGWIIAEWTQSYPAWWETGSEFEREDADYLQIGPRVNDAPPQA